ncbi:hypothetical protein MSAS_24830 [Mycobacterium saskatchewanense]|uniref:TetR/AcrR family transcriptional regulator n=1 Tax=Mycobacterium saskatchewanense TaxID=220927 RepID=UPI0011531459|nr:TetR/AcrR family transcriptional regulator [Mycobacterium saskatchewanense]BBX63309.1 hypothetical protein MSAS_24830 [Mycobacterium saskatchewanense]
MAKPLISAEKIYASALELLDTEGPSGLQARRLSAHLGISTRTLYQQVGNREELTRALVARHFARIGLQFKPYSTWDSTAYRWCMALHESLRAHPHLTEVMTIADREVIVDYVNALIKATVQEGFSRRIAVEFARTLLNVTINHSVTEVHALRGITEKTVTHQQIVNLEKNFPQTVRWIIAGVRAQAQTAATTTRRASPSLTPRSKTSKSVSRQRASSRAGAR